MRYLNKFLAFFRTGSKTVGLSPKLLAPAIGAAIAALLNAVGVTPGELGDVFGVSAEVIVAAEVTLAAKVAAYLLPAGEVTPAVLQVGSGSDAGLDPGVDAELAAVKPAENIAGQLGSFSANLELQPPPAV